ncbi:DUF6090 family protein [Psychroserpens sp. SPM9]|uniref:DUF6090 family protein n=1 Tax=Psychroserpens sp. SPM9 TaxID=2975598 RepID=UPI0021A75492|nr:DUF6090 family protein [Psychroserpens sp. SPM9]MDG5491777.1 DUF6090 family protein [Psychroserpens sp. SPM9]
MIKFFRRIRQSLLSENKFSKYLIYAVGEIILVVIGILIALQINNWNNDKANTKEEEFILKNLNFEFRKNKTDLESIKLDYQQFLKSTKSVLNLIGETEDIIKAQNTDSLISESINSYDYRPTQNVFSDLISSGNLKLISSDSLRLYLFQWSSFLNEKEEAWDTLDDFSQNMMLPYLTKNASLKNIDSYGLLDWNQKSKLTPNSFEMFQDLEFENNIDNHAWSIANYLRALENLEIIINKIIAETSKVNK